MIAVISSLTMEAERQWNGIFKRDERNQNLSKNNLYVVKIFFKRPNKDIFR